MEYTSDQYKLMEKLNSGLYLFDLPEDDFYIFHYLVSENIVQPKAYIHEDYYELSEYGKRLLTDHKEKIQKESEESEKISRQKAKQESQQRFENKIAVANLLIPFITFILGIITEHFAGILRFIASFFK